MASPKFSELVIACIIIAGINVGVQTYPAFEDNDGLAAIDLLVQLVFTCDCAVKIFQEGSQAPRYW